MSRSPRIAYLYSRYPVVSQTFCDSEMLELEDRGVDLTIASINPPLDTFRHERFARFKAEVLYPAPPTMVKAEQAGLEASGVWEEKLGPTIRRHEQDYGPSFKAATRARNAAWFARRFQERGIQHIHVHFANRATHTALFIKQLAGIPFSFTAHAQDFMVDLGSDDLLREMCREAEFTVAVSDFSRDLLAKTCPDSEDRILRVYNGIRMADFPEGHPETAGKLKIVTTGRLIEFKGFHHLLDACARLKERRIPFECCIIGQGPWKKQLLEQRDRLGLRQEVEFTGIMTQEQVKARLAASNVFCLPCIVDSKGASDILPTVIMEAMAVSLPVVSTRLVGVPEMVEDGKTGILAEPGNVDELADALQRLARDPVLRASMGRAGKLMAETRFQRSERAGELLQKMAEAHPNDWKKTEGPPQPEITYLLDYWPPKEESRLAGELDFVHQEEGFGFLSCSARELKYRDFGPQAEALFPRMEFIADAMVLEANWHHDAERVNKIFKLRQALGSTMNSERFFADARRALEVAVMCRKRKIRHLHAAREGSAVTAWLVWKLGAVQRFSFAVGKQSRIDSKVLDRLEEDACLCSRVDVEDHLQLVTREPKRVKVGLARLELTRMPTPTGRDQIYRDWVEKLRATGQK